MAELKIQDAGRLSHAYIISAQSREESLRRAKLIAAAAVCTGKAPLPCGKCRACRKAESGIHPDIINVGRLKDDKGRAKKEIGVEQIRQLSVDALVLPNESERKVYIIEEADYMNVQAQNAALKLLEEPPKGVIFLLCVTNAGQLLSTVRSRCLEINCNGGESEPDGEKLKLAREYFKAIGSGSRLRLFRFCMKNEDMDGREAADFIDCCTGLLADMLCGREPAQGIKKEELLRISELMKRCTGYLKVNVGVKHIFGLLGVDSLPAAEKEDK